MVNLTKKVCTRCKEIKPLSSFYLCYKTIYRADCKTCYNKLRNEMGKARESWNKASKKAYEKYKYKFIARANLRYAVKKGEIQKEPCFCGEEKVQAHHHLGYDGENAYKVQWRCLPHHYEVHRRNI